MQLKEVRQLRQLEQHIDVKDKPGVYLFFNAINGLVLYVGRSDKSLRRRIKNRAYTYYSFIHCDTVHEAYWLECRFYHEYCPVDNKIHPATPRGFNLVSHCPGCGYRKNPFKANSSSTK